MTPLGWAFMLFAWMAITGLVVYSFGKIWKRRR